jgi:hypothetical protein
MVGVEEGGSIGHVQVKLVGHGRLERVARMNRWCDRSDTVPLRHGRVESERMRERAGLWSGPKSR